MADRVALMFDGQIHAIGLPRDVYSGSAGAQDSAISDEKVAAYFRDFLLVEGVVNGGLFTATDGSGMTCRLDRPDGPCSLMLNITK